MYLYMVANFLYSKIQFFKNLLNFIPLETCDARFLETAIFSGNGKLIQPEELNRSNKTITVV